MASYGDGVCLDASVPPQRLTADNEAHADIQTDGITFAYDLNRVWACMGRLGNNTTSTGGAAAAIMRYGLVEEGDPVTGAVAGWIGQMQGGVSVPDAALATIANGTQLLTSAALFGAVTPGMWLAGPGVTVGTYVRDVIDANNLVASAPVAVGVEPLVRTFLTNRWNSLLPYCPIGGAAAGDYAVFGALAPFSEIGLHLDAATATQPALAVDYSTGPTTWSRVYVNADMTTTDTLQSLGSADGAFAGVTVGMPIVGAFVQAGTTVLSVTDAWNLTMSLAATGSSTERRTIGSLLAVPDFTQANGRKTQPLRFVRPTTWLITQPTGAAVPTPSYYFARLVNVAGVAAAPVANHNYKDWLDGYHKNWFAEFDIRRGDERTGSDVTGWKQAGGFTLRFRTGYTLTCKTTILSTYEMGTKHLSGDAWRPGYGWAVVCTKGGNVGRGFVGYGGAFLLFPVSDNAATGLAFWGAASSTQGILKYMMIAGVSGSAAVLTLGAAGSSALMEVANVMVWDSPTSVSGILVTIMAMDTTQGRVNNLVLAFMPNTNRVVNSSIASVILDAMAFYGDAATLGTAQVMLSGAGYKTVYQPRWAGPDKKWYALRGREAWRAKGYVSAKVDGLPIIVPFRITDSASIVQGLGLTGADGYTSFINGGGYSLPAVGVKAQNLICAERTDDADAALPAIPLDQPLRIEVNPSDAAGYDPLFESVEIIRSFPQELRWNDRNQVWESLSWQRTDMPWSVALGPPPVGGGALLADFTVQPGGGTPPLAVQFTDESDPGPDGPLVSWAWNFGDGNTSTDQSPLHTFLAAGSYDVSLTVTDSVAATSSKTSYAIVVVSPPVIPPNPTLDMPYLEQPDITLMFGDIGQDISVAGVTVQGFIDRISVRTLPGPTGTMVQGVVTTVSVLTGSLPGLAVGVTLGADGDTFIVRQFMQVGDGAITEIYCAQVPGN